ncbi:unnamed protein product, partial [Lymnaea stagnalis]
MQVVGKVSRISSSKGSEHPRVNEFIIPTSNGCVLNPSQDDRDGSPSGPVEDIFKCKFCTLAFSHQIFLDNHLRRKHNDDYWKMKQVEVSREQTDQSNVGKYLLQRSLKKKETSPVRVRQL